MHVLTLLVFFAEIDVELKQPEVFKSEVPDN